MIFRMTDESGDFSAAVELTMIIIIIMSGGLDDKLLYPLYHAGSTKHVGERRIGLVQTNTSCPVNRYAISTRNSLRIFSLST